MMYRDKGRLDETERRGRRPGEWKQTEEEGEGEALESEKEEQKTKEEKDQDNYQQN